MINAGLDTGTLGSPTPQFVPSSYVSLYILSRLSREQFPRLSVWFKVADCLNLERPRAAPRLSSWSDDNETRMRDFFGYLRGYLSSLPRWRLSIWPCGLSRSTGC